MMHRVLLGAAFISGSAMASEVTIKDGHLRVPAIPGTAVCMDLPGSLRSCVLVDDAGKVWIEENIGATLPIEIQGAESETFSVYDQAKAEAGRVVPQYDPDTRDRHGRPRADRPSRERRDHEPRVERRERENRERRERSSPVIDVQVGDVKVDVRIGNGNGANNDNSEGGGNNNCTDCHDPNYHRRKP